MVGNDEGGEMVVGNDGGKKGVVGSEGGEGVVGRVEWGREWWVGRDERESIGQGGMVVIVPHQSVSCACGVAKCNMRLLTH